jgi:hypothetical protein
MIVRAGLRSCGWDSAYTSWLFVHASDSDVAVEGNHNFGVSYERAKHVQPASWRRLVQQRPVVGSRLVSPQVRAGTLVWQHRFSLRAMSVQNADYVLRGGSWFSVDTSYARAAYRLMYHPLNCLNDVGFRCSI